MKVLPQNNYLYVEFLGRGERVTPSGVVALDEKPQPTEVVSLKILAVDAEEKLFKSGQIVTTQKMFTRPIGNEALIDVGESRAMLARNDVMAVLEDDGSETQYFQCDLCKECFAEEDELEGGLCKSCQEEKERDE